MGKVDYDVFRMALKRSDAHVYLTYPFVASWSLREAMATGCAVIGSQTASVEEFVTDRQTGLLTPFFDTQRIAESILEILEDRPLAARLRHEARRFAEAELSLEGYLAKYDALIASIVK